MSNAWNVRGGACSHRAWPRSGRCSTVGGLGCCWCRGRGFAAFFGGFARFGRFCPGSHLGFVEEGYDPELVPALFGAECTYTDETDYERSHKAGQHYWHAANEGNTDVENGGFGPRHVVYRHLDEIEDGDAEGVRQYWHNDAGEEGVELCSEDAEEGACNKEYVEEDPYVFGDCAESHSDSAGNNIKRNYSPPGYTAVGPEG